MKSRQILIAGAAGLAVALMATSASATKKAPYPEVKVDLPEPFSDPALEGMRKKLAAAAAKKDTAAILALVGPTFVWTYRGGPSEQFDMGRSALDNFKVVFGFRAPDADSDGGVDDGPYWDALQEFAEDDSTYQATEAGNLVCAPSIASVSDADVDEEARKKVETEEDPAEWYFSLGQTNVMKAPGDKGQPMAKIGAIAMPVLSAYPPNEEGAPPKPTTHIEVLLPSGKSGWVAKSAVRPISTSRLCYSKTPAGDWKISAYDQYE